MDNEVKEEVKTEEVKDTPKKSNKTLIIVLSIVGGLVLLGIIAFIAVYNLIIKPVVTVQENTKNKINNILEQGEELQNEIINEVNEQLEDIEDEIDKQITSNEENELFAYSQTGFSLKITGTPGEEHYGMQDPATNQKLYVNDEEITEFSAESADDYSVTKFTDGYVLIVKFSQAQFSTDKAYVFNTNGKFIGSLPKDRTDKEELYQSSKITTNGSNTIMVTLASGITVVQNPGEVISTTKYYRISNDSLEMFNEENTYAE